MHHDTLVRAFSESTRGAPRPGEPCVLVLFGASGDLTRRLLMPSLFNLLCDGLLSPHFAVVGIALDDWSSDRFRQHLAENLKRFTTRHDFDANLFEQFLQRLTYVRGNFDDPQAYRRLAEQIGKVDAEVQAGGNVLFYLATPPSVFGLIATQLAQAGLHQRPKGWTRLIIEKPFGHDLESARALNRTILTHWAEEQLYRIDHYLGKETVQNLLAFRFANGIFEPLWNKGHIDHIQFTVAETVGVEGRGAYYDKTGVLRDMVQNHMFQMLAYLCMEPPASFRAEAVRNEKAKLLEAVRVYKPDEVNRHAVRGQYGPGRKADSSPAVGYRQEPNVDPTSRTETFVALQLFIDNWRWDKVPIYLRSGKNLWKRGTEIAVQFARAPEVLFRGTPVGGRLASNQLLFHMQPDQGIELRFQAKTPGPAMSLQKVNMRFDYQEAFDAPRGTGYEVLLYNCMTGDATLFSRNDLVESAWRIAQPLLDAWSATAPDDFPNYAAGSWGPKAAFDLMERDGRHWLEILNRSVLENVPLFQGSDAVFLHNLAMMLNPIVAAAGEEIVRVGDAADAMYVIARGQVEVIDAAGNLLSTLGEGDFFGELGLLNAQPRRATVRAKTVCDLFVLERADFEKALRENPQLAERFEENARQRYGTKG